MTADRFEDERWALFAEDSEVLPLDLDFDAGDVEPDQQLDLPPGHHLVVRWRGREALVRIAVDLPDIAEYGKRTG